MKRQVDLQKEMAAQKREAAERRLAEKRKGSETRSKSRHQSAESVGAPAQSFRSDSPPIPTIRNRSPEKAPQAGRTGDGEDMAEQLANMRQGLERRQEKMKQEDGVWDGLAEL